MEKSWNSFFNIKMSGCGVLKQLERNYWELSRDAGSFGSLNSITLTVLLQFSLLEKTVFTSPLSRVAILAWERKGKQKKFKKIKNTCVFSHAVGNCLLGTAIFLSFKFFWLLKFSTKYVCFTFRIMLSTTKRLR